jgi:hypothetical protein
MALLRACAPQQVGDHRQPAEEFFGALGWILTLSIIAGLHQAAPGRRGDHDTREEDRSGDTGAGESPAAYVQSCHKPETCVYGQDIAGYLQ